MLQFGPQRHRRTRIESVTRFAAARENAEQAFEFGETHRQPDDEHGPGGHGKERPAAATGSLDPGISSTEFWYAAPASPPESPDVPTIISEQHATAIPVLPRHPPEPLHPTAELSTNAGAGTWIPGPPALSDLAPAHTSGPADSDADANAGPTDEPRQHWLLPARRHEHLGKKYNFLN